MKEKLIHLAKDFSIPATDYASQANAILGIREAGKTYTATKAAEELMDAGIPIIVYDPPGIWKNLKIGQGKHKGYPIVTAGGTGSDIRLTTANACDIVRAAMKENINLIIDLMSPELINKSTWIRIVQETTDLLMYENMHYGLRHIFLEEAAEFIPQKIQPQQGRVYASLERVARMGRNVGLGLTLVNQRAEEVNKAILEICTFSIIHKQVGKNSLNSIKKWLELREIPNALEIVKSLPLLNHGEAWAIGLSDIPKKIHVLPKNTFHPNPKKDKGHIQPKPTTNIGPFVDRLNKQLEVKATKITDVVPLGKKGSGKSTAAAVFVDTKTLEENNKLVDQNRLLQKQVTSAQKLIEKMRVDMVNISKSAGNAANSYVETYNNIFPAADIAINSSSTYASPAQRYDKVRQQTSVPAPTRKPIVANTSNGKLGKCALSVLRFLAQYPSRIWSTVQVAVYTGYSATGGGFLNSVYQLNKMGLISHKSGMLQVNNVPNLVEFTGKIEPQDYNAHTFLEKLAKCEKEIYQVLLDHPTDEFTKEEIAAKTPTNYAPEGGGFMNSIYSLNSLGLIKKENGLIKLNPELLEL